MREHGFEDPPEEFDFTGGFKRFSTRPGRRDDAGWIMVLWDDQPTAVYGDWREGTRFTFSPGRDDAMKDPERRREIMARIDEERVRRRKAQREAQRAASKRCLDMWIGKSIEVTDSIPLDHPYLAAKQILPVGIVMHVKSRSLIVPVRDHRDNLRSLQFIDTIGRKRFARGAPVQGFYARLGDHPGYGETVYLCEGYATGATIKQATKCTTFVAFSAGNLLPVMKRLRMRYGKDLCIVVAGDNDCETDGNPGVTAATKAAAMYGGLVAIPKPISRKPADWNDVWCLSPEKMLKRLVEATKPVRGGGATPDSLDEFKEIEREAQLAVTAPDETDPDAWKRGLLCDDKGRIKALEANAVLLLQCEPDLKGLVRWNAFHMQVELTRAPSWPTTHTRYPAFMTDSDRTSLLVKLQRAGISFNRRQIDEALRAVPSWGYVDPLFEAINALEWDGQERISRWLVDYCGADDTEYVRTVGRKFLIGAIARALKPGAKVDSTLVIEGKQGTGKSSLVRALAMRPEFASDAFPNLKTDRYPEMRLRGCWIMEVPELTGVSKADINLVKEFLTRHEDRSRDPYSSVIESRPRRCVFIATTNQSEYLRDPTGSRRFWPVHTGAIKLNGLTKIAPQLWAEAKAAYLAGEKWHLEGLAIDSQIKQASLREVADPLVDMIESYVRYQKLNAVSPAEVMWAVMADEDRVQMSRFSHTDRARVTAALTSMGWVKAVRTRWCKAELGSRVDVWISAETMERITGSADAHSITHEQLADLALNPKYYSIPPETMRALNSVAPIRKPATSSFHDRWEGGAPRGGQKK